MVDDDILINMACLEAGIVPFCGGTKGHIMSSLDSLDLSDKRTTTRKFRKILKRAIHYRSKKYSADNDKLYDLIKYSLRVATGLESSFKKNEVVSGTSQTMHSSQSNLKLRLVREYLGNL